MGYLHLHADKLLAMKNFNSYYTHLLLILNDQMADFLHNPLIVLPESFIIHEISIVISFTNV
jgi:hypothetical protein